MILFSIATKVLQTFQDIPLKSSACFAGEVGLSGEIRAVNRIEQRIQEADRLGFQQIFISKYNMKGIDMARFNIEIVTLTKLEDLYHYLFA